MDEVDEQDWPFDAWLRLAVTQMHLSPDAFWNMDLCDWLTLCKRRKAQILQSNELYDLMTLYPDTERQNDAE